MYYFKSLSIFLGCLLKYLENITQFELQWRNRRKITAKLTCYGIRGVVIVVVDISAKYYSDSLDEYRPRRDRNTNRCDCGRMCVIFSSR